MPNSQISEGKRVYICAKYKATCQYCGEFIHIFAGHVDHIVPRRHGGSNRSENLVWSCPQCNLVKHAKSIEDFRTFLRVVSGIGGVPGKTLTFTPAAREVASRVASKSPPGEIVFEFERANWF